METLKTNNVKIERLCVAVADLMMLAISVRLSSMVADLFSMEDISSGGILQKIIFAFVCYLPLLLFLPPKIREDYAHVVVANSLLTALLHAIFLILYSYTFDTQTISRIGVFSLYLIFSLLLVLGRLLLFGYFSNVRSRKSTKRVLLVGNQADLADLYDALKKNETQVLGFFSDELSPSFMGVPNLGQTSDVLPYLKGQNEVSRVFCTLGVSEFAQIYGCCHSKGIVCEGISSNLNVLGIRWQVNRQSLITFLAPKSEPLNFWWNRLLKRAFDIVMSCLFLLIVFPFVYLCIALLLKRKSPGPIFVFEKSEGKNGKTFDAVRFRMYNDCFLKRMPLFLNVLRGDLSIVGTRLFSVGASESYNLEFDKYFVRDRIKPGLCYCSVMEPITTDGTNYAKKNAKNDIWYAQNWSFWLDVIIVLKSIMGVFSRGKK